MINILVRGFPVFAAQFDQFGKAKQHARAFFRHNTHILFCGDPNFSPPYSLHCHFKT